MTWTTRDIQRLEKKGHAVTMTAPPKQKTKRNKYGNTKTLMGGQNFDSKKESVRFADLQLLQKAREISGLKKGVPFPLIVNNVQVAVYIADAVYWDERANPRKYVVEDTKSDSTRKIERYRLKKRLMKACYGIEILET